MRLCRDHGAWTGFECVNVGLERVRGLAMVYTRLVDEVGLG